MSKTVTAFGREWCHQQFHGLVDALVHNEIDVRISTWGAGEVRCALYTPKGNAYGDAPTIWLALVSAVEKMEGEV